MAIINKETIISAFDNKMTLLQFLKSIEKALVEGILKNVKVVRVDNGHVKIVFTFEDGTTQETNSIVLGEADLFTLATLIEGSESVVVDINENNTALEVHIDANVMRKINNSLQLPVARPSEQKLVGVDTSNAQNLLGLGEGLQTENNKVKVGGNINLNGNFTANSIVENMTGYSMEMEDAPLGWSFEKVYFSLVKNGNKLTIVCALNIMKTSDSASSNPLIGVFIVPQDVANKIFPSGISSTDVVDNRIVAGFDELFTYKDIIFFTTKYGVTFNIAMQTYYSELELNKKYYCRYETTFLLSEDLAG